jgi:dTDP-4-amino-4,6-dideoxygalactose transaminase
MSAITVPFLDLAQVYRAHKPILDRAWQRVAERGWFVLGPELERFEREFAAVVQAPWCVGVANGTDAIELGLRTLGIGSGTEVVTTPLTAMPTLMGIAATGARIRLADVARSTGLVDPAAMAAAVGPTRWLWFPYISMGRPATCRPYSKSPKRTGCAC